MDTAPEFVACVSSGSLHRRGTLPAAALCSKAKIAATARMTPTQTRKKKERKKRRKGKKEGKKKEKRKKKRKQGRKRKRPPAHSSPRFSTGIHAPSFSISTHIIPCHKPAHLFGVGGVVLQARCCLLIPQQPLRNSSSQLLSSRQDGSLQRPLSSGGSLSCHIISSHAWTFVSIPACARARARAVLGPGLECSGSPSHVSRSHSPHDLSGAVPSARPTARLAALCCCPAFCLPLCTACCPAYAQPAALLAAATDSISSITLT